MNNLLSSNVVGLPSTQPLPSAFAILRRKQVQAETGYSRSTIYNRIAQGLLPRGISIGPRARGWPASEVAAVNAARIAGKSDDDIRALVTRLEAERAMTCG